MSIQHTIESEFPLYAYWRTGGKSERLKFPPCNRAGYRFADRSVRGLQRFCFYNIPVNVYVNLHDHWTLSATLFRILRKSRHNDAFHVLTHRNLSHTILLNRQTKRTEEDAYK